MANFVSYQNSVQLMTAIGNKLKAVEGAYVFRGSVTFANLPSTLTRQMNGYVYNVSDDFVTDARFVEGAGKAYSAGSNVAIADLSVDSYTEVTPVGTENPSEEGWYELDGSEYVLTEDTTIDSGKTYYEKTTTVDVKFDVLGSFVDVAAIYGMIAGTFNTATAYETGDVVIYEDGLYKFNTDHAAGAWNPAEVDAVNVVDLIQASEPDSLTAEQIASLLALLN